MRNPDQLSLLDLMWEMDRANSFARLHISRKRPDGIYLYCGSVEVKPYPNPARVGGMWTGGSFKTERELKKVISDFQRFVDSLKPKGINLEVEIIRDAEPKAGAIITQYGKTEILQV